MPSRWINQLDFSTGELDPRAEWRLDIERYSSSLDLARNVLINKTGSARVRGGWRWVGDVPSNARVQLIGWEQAEANYLLAPCEDGKLYLYDESDALIETLEPMGANNAAYVLTVMARDTTNSPSSAPDQVTQTSYGGAAGGSRQVFGVISPPVPATVNPGWINWGNQENEAIIAVAVRAAVPAPTPAFNYEAPTVHEQPAVAATWSPTHTFSSDTNYCQVRIGREGNVAVSSVVIDPGGAAIALSQLAVESNGTLATAEVWAVFGFTPISGPFTVQITFASAVAGAAMVDTFVGAAGLPGAQHIAQDNDAGFGLRVALAVPGGGFGADAIGEIDTASDSKQVLLFHEGVEPHVLEEHIDLGWHFHTYPIQDYPYHRFQPPGVTLDPSGNSGNVTLTTSEAHWKPEHIGSIVRFGSGKDRIQVTGYQSGTVVNATVLDTLPNNAPTTEWDERVWSFGRGFPVSGCWHQGRLVIGGSRDLRDGLWASKVGEIEASATGISFDEGTLLDDEAIWARLRADEGVNIEYVRSQGPLLILASGTEWIVAQQPVTPTNIAFDRQASQGVARLKPADLDGAVLYVRSARAGAGEQGEQPVIHFAWDELSQRYRPGDIGVLGQHLIRNPVDMAAARGSTGDANNTLFLANDDGTVACLHLPSVERPGVTLLEGVIEPYSLAVSAGRLYAAAEFNGAHRIFRLDPASSLDASVTFDSNGLSGVGPWLVGASGVVVKGFGAAGEGWLVQNATAGVSGFEVATAVDHGELGIPFEWRLRPLPREASPATVGSLKSAVEARLVVADMIGIEFGDAAGRVEMTLDDGSAPWDLSTDPATAFTGHLREHIGGWGEETIAEAGSAQPWGGTVLAINVKVEF